MTLTHGSRLGGYEILGSLGAGGMGEVYRARDTKLNRDVAIKVLLPAVANDPDRLARFSREAQLLASLNHPNIAQIFGLEEGSPSGGSEGQDPPYVQAFATTDVGRFLPSGPAGRPVRALVMELVEGPTLADLIAGTVTAAPAARASSESSSSAARASGGGAPRAADGGAHPGGARFPPGERRRGRDRAYSTGGTLERFPIVRSVRL